MLEPESERLVASLLAGEFARLLVGGESSRVAVALDPLSELLPLLREPHAGRGALADQLEHVRRRLDYGELRLAADLTLVASRKLAGE